MGDDSPLSEVPVGEGQKGRQKPFWRRLLGRPWPDVDVLLLKSRDCPLCDEALAELARLRVSLGLSVRSRFLDEDKALEDAHRNEVPVIFVGGRKLGIGRVDRWQLRRRVEAERRRLTGAP